MKSSPDPPPAPDPASSVDIKAAAAPESATQRLHSRISILHIVVPPAEPAFWSKTSLIQFGYGVWINQTCIVIGLTFGFTSVAIPMLRKDSVIQMNLSQEAWIAGSITLCAPIGSMLAGLLMDKYGRQPIFTLSEAPVVLGWFCIGIAKSATFIIIGRIIIGIGLGFIFTAPRAYLTEISLPNMRGINGAMPNTFLSIGLIIMAGLAVFFEWQMISYICAIYSILLMISYKFLPETPHFVLMTSPDRAKEVLQKFRSKRYDVDAEMKTLLDFREKNNIHRLTLREKIVAIVEPSVYKPFLISFVFITLTQLAGVNVVIMWNIEMLELSKTTTSAKEGNIIICVTRIIAGIFTSIILYKAKRRVMSLISAVGVGFSALGVFIYLHMQVGVHIAPLILYMSYVTFACLGYYTLPFMIMSEILPLQHRGLLCGVNVTSMNFMIFGMNKAYPYMREAIGLANVMAIYGGISLVGSIILFYILPETSQLTLQEIEEYFNKRRPVLTTSRRLLTAASLSNQRLNRSNVRFLDVEINKRHSKGVALAPDEGTLDETSPDGENEKVTDKDQNVAKNKESDK